MRLDMVWYATVAVMLIGILMALIILPAARKEQQARASCERRGMQLVQVVGVSGYACARVEGQP